MNETDLRELDGWIAEHIFEREIVWDEERGPFVKGRWPVELMQPAKRYSSDSSAFALVKREIERRGWDWEVMSSGGVPSDNRFKFVIALLAHSRVSVKIAEADSEELAGCLAVKAAVEGSNAHSD